MAAVIQIISVDSFILYCMPATWTHLTNGSAWFCRHQIYANDGICRTTSAQIVQIRILFVRSCLHVCICKIRHIVIQCHIRLSGIRRNTVQWRTAALRCIRTNNHLPGFLCLRCPRLRCYCAGRSQDGSSHKKRKQERPQCLRYRFSNSFFLLIRFNSCILLQKCPQSLIIFREQHALHSRFPGRFHIIFPIIQKQTFFRIQVVLFQQISINPHIRFDQVYIWGYHHTIKIFHPVKFREILIKTLCGIGKYIRLIAPFSGIFTQFYRFLQRLHANHPLIHTFFQFFMIFFRNPSCYALIHFFFRDHPTVCFYPLRSLKQFSSDQIPCLLCLYKFLQWNFRVVTHQYVSHIKYQMLYLCHNFPALTDTGYLISFFFYRFFQYSIIYWCG